jgi:hypothetical protein
VAAPAVLYVVHGARRVPLPANRIDAEGAFVKSSLLFEKGEELDFEVELPGRTVRGTAAVKGLLTGGAVRGMILEFVRLDDEARRALAAAAAAEEG